MKNDEGGIPERDEESGAGRMESGGEGGSGGGKKVLGRRSSALGSARSDEEENTRTSKITDQEKKRLRAHPVEVRIADEPRLQAALAGRPAHAANCDCNICKPPKEEK